MASPTAGAQELDLDEQGYPPFRLGNSRFDQSTFGGRYRHFLDIVDPSTLFTSNAKLESSIHLLNGYKNGTLPPNTTNKQLWHAQKIKQASIHPDTEKKILMPFRMSGFVVFGAPIVTGLLLPNLTLQGTLFWQWLNQSHNACVNYANRNATKPTPTSRFILGYTGAVTSACAIATCLKLLIDKAKKFNPSTRLLIQRFVPFPAVATASVCNVVLMRFSELGEGIEVGESDGKVVGTSKIAAKRALTETALTRAVLPAPVLIIPPIVMALLERTHFLRRKPKLNLPIQAAICTLTFAFTLPMAISLFPQFSKVDVSTLEAEIQAATSCTQLVYNKGL